MRYIENNDLREWVKETLRKNIFQKAHALAVQTGCEILVKLEDHHDSNSFNQYYATHLLQEAFRHGGVSEKPEDQCISGETGMPLIVIPTAEMGVQSIPMDPGGAQPNVDRGKFQCPSESPSRSSSLKHHKSPASSQKRNSPFDRDISPSHPSESGSSSVKRKKSHKSKSTPPSSDSDAQQHLVKHQQKQSPAAGGGLTLSPVPVKQFHCPICGKGLKSARSLEKHTKTFHSDKNKEDKTAKGSGSHNKGGHSSKQSYKEEPPASTPISPQRYGCQKCDEVFDSPDTLDVHVKNFHKKLSLTPLHKVGSSPKKSTPKRDNLTPKRDNLTPKRDDHNSKHEHHTPKRNDNFVSKRGEHSPWYQDDYGHKSESHTPKSSHHHLTPTRQGHTSRHENHNDFTSKRDSTPKHDLTPRRDATPKSDITTPRHLQDHTSSLPSLGLSPQPPFVNIDSPGPSSASSSPLSAPKTPGESTQFFFEHETHTSLTDLPGSPRASQSSGSEPSRPNTPGEDAPSMSYEFSEEIQTSIMNIPSISPASEFRESPASPMDHYSPRTSSKGFRMTSPDASHKKSPKKALRVSDFKAAILSTPGPIVTTASLQKNGPPSVRQISRIQFESAIQGLQIADFGYVVPLTVRHNAVLVFVKKAPQEIQEVWTERAEDLGLCSLQKYRELYNLPAPSDISPQVKSQLIDQGHVTVEQMNGAYSSMGYEYTMSMEY